MATHDFGCFGAFLGWRGCPVVIRNTFLHTRSNNTDQLLSEQLSSLRKAKSDSTYARDPSAQAYKIEKWSALTIVQEETTLPLTPTASTVSDVSKLGDLSTVSECGSSRGEVVVEATNPKQHIGSSGHDAGTCKPCIWYWRQGGCRRGDDCEHCHLCDAQEIRRRKKALKRNLQASSK
jgi:hypothetical protein